MAIFTKKKEFRGRSSGTMWEAKGAATRLAGARAFRRPIVPWLDLGWKLKPPSMRTEPSGHGWLLNGFEIAMERL